VRCIRRGVHPTPPPPHPPTEGARFSGFTRSLAEGMERAAERRTSVRSVRVEYRFDEARTLRAAVIRQRPVGWPCSGLTGTWALPFPEVPAIEEDEPLQAKTHPFALNHADGGRVSPASSAPDRSSIPLEPVPARPPPAAANGRWPCAPSSRRGGSIVQVISTRMIQRRIKIASL